MRKRNAALMGSLGMGLGVASLALPNATNTAQASCYDSGPTGADGSCEDCEASPGSEECTWYLHGVVVEPGHVVFGGQCQANGANGSCSW